MQAHVGDMVWCDGKIVTVQTKYTPDDSTVVYYLALACHDERGNTTYVDAKAVKKNSPMGQPPGMGERSRCHHQRRRNQPGNRRPRR